VAAPFYIPTAGYEASSSPPAALPTVVITCLYD